MTSLRTLLIASAALTLAGASAQAAAAPGAYQLASGGNACAITLAADGSATASADCPNAAGVARWQAKFNGVELQTASGETVALLRGKDGSYAGTRFSDGRALSLSADGSAVASSH